LEDGSLRRIGSVKERRVNVRLLAATNRDMNQEVEAGRFREDLYYRINVLSLKLPPLRDRAGDIPPLARHFLGVGWEIDEEAMMLLERYSWPGNIRQLSNAIERAKIMADDKRVRVRDLPHDISNVAVPPVNAAKVPLPVATDDLASIERTKVVEVLGRLRGNKTRAARALGIDRRKLYRLVEKYGVAPAEYQERAQ
jgi:DNA-binding NtrC family response regulator